MNPATRDYCALMGVEVAHNLHEDGETYRLRLGTERRQFTYLWGDDEVYFNRVITRWLNSLPWPSEDDPRIQHEGVYTS